jgi:endoglucanase
MSMFIYLRLALLFFFSLCLSSCSKDEPAPDPELTLSTDQISVSKEGEIKTLHVKSNMNWVMVASESWVSVSPASGEAGTTKVTATVAKNETAEVRIAKLTVTAGSLPKEISVTQSAATILTVSSNEVEVGADGQDVTIQITSSGQYSTAIDAEWITAVQGSPGMFKVEMNRALPGRTGSIEFTLNDVVQVVTIDQAGQPLHVPADATEMPSDAVTLTGKMTLGWNLGNTLEATSFTNGVYTASETLWGNAKTTKTLIDAVKAAGFNTIRIPCAWSGYIEDEETFRIKDSWLARVKEVIDYCIENDMYAIINIHWDGGWLEEHPLYSHQEDVIKKEKALWEQIAVYFRDYDEHLLFAGTNEVRANYNDPTAEHIEVQESYNQTFVDAVRSTGGRNSWRNIIVQGYNTNITHAYNHMTMPNDAVGTTNRLITELHFYDPYDFTLDAASDNYLWGAQFAGNEHTSNWGQEAWADDAFAKVKEKFIDNGIPVVLGEYGATYRGALTSGLADHIIARNYYLKYVTKSAKDHGIVPIYWDSGHTGNNGSGLFNRATGEQVHADAIAAIVSALE